ncbi:unnamed protein product [Amoebophrya sp. A120]|nr:unnamed protein product [Amoebophrya sp. A120]|eukprot:GSA120T00019448001.1
MGCCSSAMLGGKDALSLPKRTNSMYMYDENYEKRDQGSYTPANFDPNKANNLTKKKDKILISCEKSALVHVLKTGVLLEEYLIRNNVRGKQIIISCVDVSAKEPKDSKYYDYRWRCSSFRFFVESDVIAYIPVVTDRWLSKKATHFELAWISEAKMLWQAAHLGQDSHDGEDFGDFGSNLFPVAILSLALDIQDDETKGLQKKTKKNNNNNHDNSQTISNKNTKASGGRTVGDDLERRKILERSSGYNHNLLVLSSITQKWVRQDKSKRQLGVAGLNQFKDPRFVISGKFTVKTIDPLGRAEKPAGKNSEENKSNDPDMFARELSHHLLFSAFKQVRLEKVAADGGEYERQSIKYRAEAVRNALGKNCSVDEAHSEPEEVLTSARSRGVVNFDLGGAGEDENGEKMKPGSSKMPKRSGSPKIPSIKKNNSLSKVVGVGINTPNHAGKGICSASVIGPLDTVSEPSPRTDRSVVGELSSSRNKTAGVGENGAGGTSGNISNQDKNLLNFETHSKITEEETATTITEEVAVPANMPHLYLNFAEAKKRGPGNNSPRLSKSQIRASRAGSKAKSTASGEGMNAQEKEQEQSLSGTDAVLKRMSEQMEREKQENNAVVVGTPPDQTGTVDEKTNLKPEAEQVDDPADLQPGNSPRDPSKEVPLELNLDTPAQTSNPAHSTTTELQLAKSQNRRPTPLRSPLGQFAPGDRLVIHSLESNPEYNGNFVKVLSVQSADMIEVVVPTQGNERLFIPPANLAPLQDPKAMFPALTPSAHGSLSPVSRHVSSPTMRGFGSALDNKLFAMNPDSEDDDDDFFLEESDSDIDIPEQLLTEAINRDRLYAERFDENGEEVKKVPDGNINKGMNNQQNHLEKTMEDFLPPIYCPIDIEKLAQQLPTNFGTPVHLGQSKGKKKSLGSTLLEEGEEDDNNIQVVVAQPPGMPVIPKKKLPETVLSPEVEKEKEEEKVREQNATSKSKYNTSVAPTANNEEDDDPGVSDLDLSNTALDPGLADIDTGNLMREHYLRKGLEAVYGENNVPRELIQASLNDTRMQRGKFSVPGGAKTNIGGHQTAADSTIRSASTVNENNAELKQTGASLPTNSKSMNTASGQQVAPEDFGLPSLAKMQTTEHAKRPVPFPLNLGQETKQETKKMDMSQVVVLSDTVGNGLVGLLGAVNEENGNLQPNLSSATSPVNEENENSDPDIEDTILKPLSTEEVAKRKELALQTNKNLFAPIGGGKVGTGKTSPPQPPSPPDESKGVQQEQATMPGPRLSSGRMDESRSSSKSGSQSFTPPKAPAGIRPPSLGAQHGATSRPGSASMDEQTSFSTQQQRTSTGSSKPRSVPFALDMHNVNDPRAQFLETIVGLVVRPPIKDMGSEDHRFPSSVIDETIEDSSSKKRHFYSAFIDGSITREIPKQFRGKNFQWHFLAELRNSFLNKNIVVRENEKDTKPDEPDRDKEETFATQKIVENLHELLEKDNTKMVCYSTDISKREKYKALEEVEKICQTYKTLKNSLAKHRADELAGYFGYDWHPDNKANLLLYSEYIDGGTVHDRIQLKRLANRKEIMRNELAFSKLTSDQQAMYGLSEKEAHFILIRVLRGLEQLHYLDICHGALRASNVGINRRSGRVQLLDWGMFDLRKYCNDEGKTWKAKNCRWIAPECLPDFGPGRGSNFSKGSDIWSLGCLLLEMVSGTPPYSAIPSIARLNDFQILSWLQAGKHIPPAPEKMNSASLEFRDFCQMCLIWDHEQRPDTKSDSFRKHLYRKPGFQVGNEDDSAEIYEQAGASVTTSKEASVGADARIQDKKSYHEKKQFVTVSGSKLPMDPREFFEQQQRKMNAQRGGGSATSAAGGDQPHGLPPPMPQRIRPPPPGRQLDPGYLRPSSVHNVRNNPSRQLRSTMVPKVVA